MNLCKKLNKNKVHDLDYSIEKIGIEVNLSHSSLFSMNKNIQHSNLIDIDAHIKIIHINSTHTKLLRLFKTFLPLRIDVIKQLMFQIYS